MSEQRCGTCKWASPKWKNVQLNDDETIACNFPVPDWIARCLFDPLTGSGPLACVLKETDGEHCQTYEAKL
jgi:hypothetical protein